MESRALKVTPAEALLLRDARVREACVLGEGAEAVAWVVPRRAVRAEVLMALLRERWGEAAPAVALVDALPRRDSGEVDREALARLSPPVPSRLARLEAALRHDGVEAVAVSGPRREAEVFQPLDTLLPPALLSRAATPSAPAVRAVVAASREGRPSLLDAGPRRRAGDDPETLVALLRRAMERHPDATLTCIDVEGRREVLGFAALWDESLRLWGALEAKGLRAGDRVVLALERPADFVRSFWACCLGGAVPVPLALPPSLERSHPGVARLLAVVERLGGAPVLTDARAVEALASFGARAWVPEVLRAGAAPGRLASPRPGDTALLSFTSGSTGQPKGVVLKHEHLMAMGEAVAAGGWYGPGDFGVGWMPLDHVGSIAYSHLVALRAGTSHALVARDYVLGDVLRWLDLLTELGGTTSWAPNFAFGLVADRLERGEQRAWNLSRVRVLTCAGEPVVPATIQRFLAPLAAQGLRGDAVCPAWGMAETCSCFTITRGVRSHPSEGATELGPPLQGTALRVVDDADQVVPEGTVGHFQVRGAQVLEGYLEDAGLNAQSFTADGWFRTGDLAVVQGGQMCIAGRQKEVLIIHGNNVYPQEVEVVVESVPGVLPAHAVVCSTRSEGARTDELVVFFVPTPDAPPLPELLRSIRERVGRVLGLQVAYVVPLAREQVPRTELGKRGRTELRKRLETGALATERRESERVLGGPTAMPRCLATARWVTRPVTAVEGGAGPVVVVAEEDGVVAALRERMLGREVARVAPGDAGALTRTLDALAARGRRCEDVVVMVGRVATARASSDVAAEKVGGVAATVRAAVAGPAAPRVIAEGHAAEAGRVAEALLASSDVLATTVAPVLIAAQVLGAASSQGSVRLICASVEAPSSPDVSVADVAPLLVPGLLWSASAEVPGLEPRMVWLPSDASEAARALAEELSHPDAAREVAWRAGSRFERVFAPWSPPSLTQASEPRRLKREALYLVTGAQGGLGQAFARRLRRGLDARLLLVGRRPRGPEVETLERELGGALYVSVDVTDAQALSEAVRGAEAHFGRPCSGAFHFAGTLEAVPLARETPEGLSRRVASQGLGALAIAAVLRDRPDAVLVLAASLMGTLGAGLHAGYCASSAFVERLAEHWRASGRDAVCVSLSQVRDTGLARSLGAAPPGYRVLEPTQALAALCLAAEGAPAHLLAGVERSAWPWRLAGLGSGEPLESTHVFVAGTAAPSLPPGAVLHSVPDLPRRGDGTVDREALSQRVTGGGDSAPLGPLETVVVEAFREVLGGGDVGGAADFFTLGGSSLQATRVMARIHERTGLRLREAVLFEHPTATALAAHVRKVVDPSQLDVSALTDAQVELLLRALHPG